MRCPGHSETQQWCLGVLTQRLPPPRLRTHLRPGPAWSRWGSSGKQWGCASLSPSPGPGSFPGHEEQPPAGTQLLPAFPPPARAEAAQGPHLQPSFMSPGSSTVSQRRRPEQPEPLSCPGLTAGARPDLSPTGRLWPVFQALAAVCSSLCPLAHQ